MSEEKIAEKQIWLALAELFFLDTEPSEMDYERVAGLLKSNGWSREKTERTLIQLIAPNYAANLGFLIYPVIGEWAGFDGKVLESRVVQSQSLRVRYPNWYFSLSDWWCRKMLKALKLESFLNRL